MSALNAVFRFEIRRHLWPLITGSSALLVIPLLLSKGDSWRYWEAPGAEFITILIPSLLAPVVGSWLGAHTWAADRSEGIVEWLSARPILPSRHFFLRLLAVAVPAAVWCFLVFLLFRPLVVQSQGSLAGITETLLSWLILSLAFGLFFSALMERPGAAFLAAWISTYGFFLIVIVLGLRIGLARTLAAAPQISLMQGPSYRLTMLALELILPTAILLLATWEAVRICPGDPRRVPRGFKMLAVGGSTYVVIVAALWLWA